MPAECLSACCCFLAFLKFGKIWVLFLWQNDIFKYSPTNIFTKIYLFGLKSAQYLFLAANVVIMAQLLRNEQKIHGQMPHACTPDSYRIRYFVTTWRFFSKYLETDAYRICLNFLPIFKLNRETRMNAHPWISASDDGGSRLGPHCGGHTDDGRSFSGKTAIKMWTATSTDQNLNGKTESRYMVCNDQNLSACFSVPRNNTELMVKFMRVSEIQNIHKFVKLFSR